MVSGEVPMINVTKTWLPDKTKFSKYLDKIYSSCWVTNHGPLARELERRLCDYLGVPNVVLVANGTMALDIAYRTLEINNTAVTTPFSFVATTSSLVSRGIRPIFADINKKTFCMDPQNIENVLTQDTEAIVPVHVFGNACNVEEIDTIAKKHNLKVIYDAAHAFGVQYKGQSLLNWGDISTLSFHATKRFHTIEGGALIIKDDDLAQKALMLSNFGIENSESIPLLGTNAKMNEFEAAMGLCMLDEIDTLLQIREEIYYRYMTKLNNYVEFQQKNENCTLNYSYFPILLSSEEQLMNVKRSLNAIDVFPRRYFYPSLDTLSYIEPKQVSPWSRNISSRTLALPLYPGLERKNQNKIIKTLLKALKK